MLRAELDVPGGPLPFVLEIPGRDTRADIYNGPERLAVANVSTHHGKVELSFDHYDSRLEASTRRDDALTGYWVKERGDDDVAVPVRVTRADDVNDRFDLIPDAGEPADFSGRWRVRFSDSDDPAVGVFDCSPAPDDPDTTLATGTFLTTTGDYRFLAGRVDGGLMRLSVFDGAHAFLFHARMQRDGMIAGDFWSGDWWHETWTATRDDDYTLPDAFAASSWDAEAAAELRYPDLEGNEFALNDPDLYGPATIIDVFGSWCPNCTDAADLLAEYQRAYGERGLRILGLAFELTDDPERSRRQVRRHLDRHAGHWPVLIAGLADKDEASAALPALDRVRAYPTLIFIDHEGAVRAVHTGFFGPATGDENASMRAGFESLIEQMLTEAGR